MTYAQAAKLLRVMSTERRLEIVALLARSDEALASTFISARLSIPDNQISENLLKLADCGLLLRTASGNNRFYTLNHGLYQELTGFITQKGLE